MQGHAVVSVYGGEMGSAMAVISCVCLRLDSGRVLEAAVLVGAPPIAE